MTSARNVLTPEALAMMDVIARTGSFAAAARIANVVPSALTYRVRQMEDALDVLLFDRRSRQARLTAAGQQLLEEGRRLLEQMDAVANRVKRVATGWETQLSIAVDGVISRLTMFELCESFYTLCASSQIARPRAAAKTVDLADPANHSGPGTRLRLRTEVLTGTWEALTTGQVDLTIGVGMDRTTVAGVHLKELGQLPFVFAIAPHHPLAGATQPLSDAELLRHRAVAVADSAHRLIPLTVNLLPGQDVLTVSDMTVFCKRAARSCAATPAIASEGKESRREGSRLVESLHERACATASPPTLRAELGSTARSAGGDRGGQRR